MSVCSKCYSEYVHCYNTGCGYAGRVASPLPVIGTTVSVASLVLTLLIAADVVRSYRRRQLWIPCRFFTLSAASLAPLMIAMKLLMDLTNPTPDAEGQLSKLSSMAFLCTAMACFMPSIGSMEGVEIVYNVLGLVILVMPTLLNVLIQMFMGLVFGVVVEHIVVAFLVIFSLATQIFTAVAVPAVKEDLTKKYNEAHQGAVLSQNLGFEGMEDYVCKSWIMVQTGSPQFAVARLATSSACASICFIVLFVLVEAVIRMYMMYPDLNGFSEYRWSAYLIVVTQTAGVIIGAVVAGFRLFVTTRRGSVRVRIEEYWIKNLEKCKRKVMHPKTRLVLNILIRVQILVVQASKCLHLVAMFLLNLMVACYYNFCPVEKSDYLQEMEMGLALKGCVLMLDGEGELPDRVVRDTVESARDLIERGRAQKPDHLVKLLNEARRCIRLIELDFQGCAGCWTLPIVTLTSISIALPDAGNPAVDRLIKSVSEGLPLTGLIEKHTGYAMESVAGRRAAEAIWTGLEFQGKWLDEDLNQEVMKGKAVQEKLQWLIYIAENRLTGEGNGDGPDGVVHAEAAKSLERIAGALLRDCKGWSGEELLDGICAAVADLFCLSFGSLPSALTAMCRSGRERSVARAARLVGETEDVVEFLRRRLNN